jgi:hypothetical protein
MAEGKSIHFVTWPDGKVDDNSINIFSQGHAKCWMIRSWLPEHVFGSAKWLDPSSYVVRQIWQGMQEKGFKVHTIGVADAVTRSDAGGKAG